MAQRLQKRLPRRFLAFGFLPLLLASQLLAADADAELVRLKPIAMDGTRKAKERFEAINKIGELRTPAAFAFLLNNLAVHIPGEQIGDEDRFKNYPCSYALMDMKMDAVPHLLKYLHEPRTKREIQLAAFTLSRAAGRQQSREILEAELASLSKDPTTRERQKNLEACLASSVLARDNILSQKPLPSTKESTDRKSRAREPVSMEILQ